MNRSVFKQTLLIALLLSVFFQVQSIVAESKNGDMEVRFIAKFSTDDIVFSTTMGYDVVELEDGHCMNVVSKPALPFLNMMVALPEGMEATGVRVLSVTEEELPGYYTVFPAQPPQPVSTPGGEISFVQPDARTYNSTGSIPSQPAELSVQSDLAGQSMVAVAVYPIRYVPAEGRLTLLTSIKIAIEGVEGYVCGDYLPEKITERNRETYEKMITEMVVNPRAVELHTTDNNQHGDGLSPGAYEYVIITKNAWLDDFQRLADWKNKKGIRTVVVDRDWIYDEYPGGILPTDYGRINDFIQDAHSTWGTMYFLLGGDSGVLPFYTYFNQVGSVPSDTYYGDFDSDWICEVHVGRASTKNISQVNTFIDKVLTYELNPPLTDYAKKVGFLGFDLNMLGSNEGEDCKEAIETFYLPPGLNITKIYDRHSGNHETDTIDAINAGLHLTNHVDHASLGSMGTGSVNHGWGLNSPDAAAFFNRDKQGIYYSIGCWPCAFDYTECIAEYYVRNENGGGVAFIGNTRSGYYSPFYGDYNSLRYDRYFFRSLFAENHYKLGECFSDHKNDSYMNDPYYQFIFQELTLLGDPELPVWTENPANFESVTCPASIGIGLQDFTVHVEIGGLNADGSLVCLMKGAEVYEVGTTDPDGWVTFTINPMSEGTMHVTVTAQNHLPYEGTCEISGDVPDVALVIVPDATGVPQGGMLGYEVSVTNNSSSAIKIEYWTDISLWNGNPFGGNPVFGPFEVTVQPSGTRQGHLYHAVPPNTPLETYTCHARVGGHPGAVWVEDSFEFTVVEP